jgi:glycosyltransferase involved in cell wall biosynthesis
MPLGGDQYKNQLILEYLSNQKVNLEAIDTFNWRYRPNTILKLCLLLFFGGYDRIVVSVSSDSAYNLIRMINLFTEKIGRTLYMVIGGYLAEGIRTGNFKIKYYQGLKNIAVEGKKLEKDLLSVGLDNVVIVPNFKKVIKVPVRVQVPVACLKFVFISRITPTKGISEIFKATRILNNNGFKGHFTITFYGPIDDSFKNTFKVGLIENLTYGGNLNIMGDPGQSYQKLSEYDCMLFPTYWESEGFPGVIIDAFISSLPVIASDWNMNTEFIQDGVNGLIVKPRDAVSLADAMTKVIDNPEILIDMSKNARLRASEYSVDRVGPQIIKLLSDKTFK